MKPYSDLNMEIWRIIEDLKYQNRMTDADVGKIIGIQGASLRNKRCSGSLPQMQFAKVAELAQLAGYEIKFERRE